MNTREIETLLGKYYEGNTSLAEEKILRDFFRNGDLPDHLKEHRQLFGFFADRQSENLPDPDFERKLTEKLAGEADGATVIPFTLRNKRFLAFARVAAAILLLAGLFFSLRNEISDSRKQQAVNRRTELAYAQTTQALMIVSSNLNAGLKQVSKLRLLDQVMTDMQPLGKFYQYTLIINPDELPKKSTK